MTFIGSLVFALVFFGVWSLQDACKGSAAAAVKPVLITAVFILLAYVITRVM